MDEITSFYAGRAIEASTIMSRTDLDVYQKLNYVRQMIEDFEAFEIQYKLDLLGL